jgi:signal transduction histidine kinase
VTNVVRHAGASQCTIRLHVDQALHVVVIDNGCGVPANRQAGVGLSSMRERATELGGMLRINALPHGGTEVVAWLPLNDTAVQERRIQLAGAEG